MYTTEEIKKEIGIANRYDESHTFSEIAQQLLTQLETTEAKLAEATELLEKISNIGKMENDGGMVWYNVQGRLAREFLEKYRKDGE